MHCRVLLSFCRAGCLQPTQGLFKPPTFCFAHPCCSVGLGAQWNLKHQWFNIVFLLQCKFFALCCRATDSLGHHRDEVHSSYASPSLDSGCNLMQQVLPSGQKLGTLGSCVWEYGWYAYAPRPSLLTILWKLAKDHTNIPWWSRQPCLIKLHRPFLFLFPRHKEGSIFLHRVPCMS